MDILREEARRNWRAAQIRQRLYAGLIVLGYLGAAFYAAWLYLGH